MPSLDEDYPRYLATKRSVDDRALNRRVLDRLTAELAGAGCLCVLNVGGGIGTTLERLVRWDVLPTAATIEYTMVDLREANVEAARRRTVRWATAAGHTVSRIDDADGASESIDADREGGTDGRTRARLRIEAGERTIEVEFVVGDAFAFVERRGPWDLLVGQAFLDLFDLEAALDSLLSAVVPGGYWYFPITFDGGTVFEPPADRIPSDRLERAFHEHIDRGGGDSRAGRHLLTAFGTAGRSAATSTWRPPAGLDAEIVAAGGSDWVVVPEAGEYPNREAEFLRFIVDTVADALANDALADLPPEALAEWRTDRHRRIEAGELVYVAHQLDVLGRVSDSGTESPTEVGQHETSSRS